MDGNSRFTKDLIPDDCFLKKSKNLIDIYVAQRYILDFWRMVLDKTEKDSSHFPKIIG